MSIHLPEFHYTLIPLITPGDAPAQAILTSPHPGCAGACGNDDQSNRRGSPAV